jgi:heat shock protein HslJ
MTGGFVLDGQQLRFDQIAGTMMACGSGADLEKAYLSMFPQVRGWEISGDTLRMLDPGGHKLATFVARPNP